MSFIYFYLFSFFIVVQVQLFPFSPHHFPDPSHSHLPPLILPPFGFVHVSFIDVFNAGYTIAYNATSSPCFFWILVASDFVESHYCTLLKMIPNASFAQSMQKIWAMICFLVMLNLSFRIMYLKHRNTYSNHVYFWTFQTIINTK